MESTMGKDKLGHGIASQLLASLYMLRNCIDACPEEDWHAQHNDQPFSMVAFHTLLDCDYNLCENDAAFKKQDFHRKHRESFADYEALENGVLQNFYERDFINRYCEYCIEKVVSVIETKTHVDLLIPKADVYRNMTRLERYVNATRHIQHHAAQLGLRLQFATGKTIDWISRGYEE
jgi:hypothetical protein